MGNTDSIPVVSQGKSLAQYIGGDSAGALATQENFAYRNTFPVVSQIASLGYAIDGKNAEAKDLQEKFAEDMDRVIDSIPVAGHVKGTVHFALGQNERGEESMKAASRSTGVVIGGVGGFAVGGPVGAVAGGIAGGVAMDTIITGSELAIHGPSTSRPYGYFNIAERIANGDIDTVGEGFDAALVPVMDGVGGLAAGKTGGAGLGGARVKAIGSNIGKSKIGAAGIVEVQRPGGGVVAGAGKPSVLDIIAPPKVVKVAPVEGTVQGGTAMKAMLDNRANQLNPNHVASGPGRPAGYRGDISKPALDNHANQLNPSHPSYHSSRVGNANVDINTLIQ